MRTMHGHQINECNKALDLEADEPEPSTGAVRLYNVGWQGQGSKFPGGEPSYNLVQLPFHHGPISAGTNGLTNEVLLEVLIDRLTCFQQSAFACAENAEALDHLMCVREALHRRTEARTARGVEGTHII